MMPVNIIYTGKKLSIALIGFKIRVFTLPSKHIRALFKRSAISSVNGVSGDFFRAMFFLHSQLTAVGPQVPTSIISGKVSAQSLIQYLNN
jgi:hypothetical protein